MGIINGRWLRLNFQVLLNLFDKFKSLRGMAVSLVLALDHNLIQFYYLSY
jgi:hypothetical protein